MSSGTALADIWLTRSVNDLATEMKQSITKHIRARLIGSRSIRVKPNKDKASVMNRANCSHSKCNFSRSKQSICNLFQCSDHKISMKNKGNLTHYYPVVNKEVSGTSMNLKSSHVILATPFCSTDAQTLPNNNLRIGLIFSSVILR